MRHIPIAVLTAGLLLTGCSTAAVGGQDERPTRAPAAAVDPEPTSGPAVECFVDVSNMLVMIYRSVAGQLPKGNEEEALGAFYVKYDGGPEIDIYEKYSKRGAEKIAKDSVNGHPPTEDTPLDTATKYARSIKQECNEAYPS